MAVPQTLCSNTALFFYMKEICLIRETAICETLKADDSVNVDTAHGIEKKVLNEKARKKVMSYSFK